MWAMNCSIEASLVMGRWSDYFGIMDLDSDDHLLPGRFCLELAMYSYLWAIKNRSPNVALSESTKV